MPAESPRQFSQKGEDRPSVAAFMARPTCPEMLTAFPGVTVIVESKSLQEVGSGMATAIGRGLEGTSFTSSAEVGTAASSRTLSEAA